MRLRADHLQFRIDLNEELLVKFCMQHEVSGLHDNSVKKRINNGIFFQKNLSEKEEENHQSQQDDVWPAEKMTKEEGLHAGIRTVILLCAWVGV
jgi:hypothetical protein